MGGCSAPHHHPDIDRKICSNFVKAGKQASLLKEIRASCKYENEGMETHIMHSRLFQLHSQINPVEQAG
jgi:hypothetical protein